jgi:nitroimidazol reductase NimA-like FMN-containing flavoprotein (pyridoxamine 5'-phosphate oxidase superfamily)
MGLDDTKKSEDEFNDQIREDFAKVLKKDISDRSQEELKDRIVRFLNRCQIGSLATCANNMPRSTPVRFGHRDLTVFVLTEGGGKLQNIKENPNVCFSVYGTYTGFRSCRGIQMWGKAEILSPSDKEVYVPAFKMLNLEEREDLKKLDMADVRMDMPIIKIAPERIRYLSVPEGILNQELEINETAV